jgi:hypothetical protein
MADTLTKDGYTRFIYKDCVHWVVKSDDRFRLRRIVYCIARFPFVPDYHLCDLVEDYPNPNNVLMAHICERPLQQFKTLTQALAVLRVIEGSRP